LFLYHLFISCYFLIIRLLSFRNKKAKEWILGRQNWQIHLKEAIGGHTNWVWVHCASAGEFEQGKPVIERLKNEFPGVKVLVSFFSPSGFGVGKKYKHADYVTYLPLDTQQNAADFINIVQPRLAVFVKYDYWYHHLKTTANKSIPLLLISAIFRKEQPFFKWYGGLHRRMLGFFSQIFVQDAHSAQLLKKIGVTQCTISGDTRFDRVATLTQEIPHIEAIEAFVADHQVLVAGSTWPDDERLLQKATSSVKDLKIIIAPHEIHPAHIEAIRSLFPQSVCFSQLNTTNAAESKVLIIDNIGMLSRLYHYATLTYIGGGFNKSGIHNTLEAAVWGKPVFFGPNYKKFGEARGLIACGAAWSESDPVRLKEHITHLLTHNSTIHHTGEKANHYVMTNVGATEKIMQYIRQNVF